MKISEMTNSQLRDEYISYDELINVVGCYGTKDIRILHAIEQEIDRRGGTITTRTDVVFDEEIEDMEEIKCLECGKFFEIKEDGNTEFCPDCLKKSQVAQ